LRVLNGHLRTRAARNEHIFAFLRYRAHLFSETIAPPGEGHDVAAILGSVSQCSAEQEDVLGKVRFFDKSVRPDGLHKVILGNNLTTVADQDQESLKGLRGEGHGLVFAEQNLFIGIHPKRPELIENFRSRSHGGDANGSLGSAARTASPAVEAI
jgi:hypothetical protein